MNVETHTGTRRLTSVMTLSTRRPDLLATTNVARCRPVTANPSTAEPTEAANDGTNTKQWIGETATAKVTVDLGAAQQIDSVTLSRNALTTYPPPPGGDKGVTRATSASNARVQVRRRRQHLAHPRHRRRHGLRTQSTATATRCATRAWWRWARRTTSL